VTKHVTRETPTIAVASATAGERWERRRTRAGVVRSLPHATPPGRRVYAAAKRTVSAPRRNAPAYHSGMHRRTSTKPRDRLSPATRRGALVARVQRTRARPAEGRTLASRCSRRAKFLQSQLESRRSARCGLRLKEQLGSRDPPIHRRRRPGERERDPQRVEELVTAEGPRCSPRRWRPGLQEAASPVSFLDWAEQIRAARAS